MADTLDEALQLIIDNPTLLDADDLKECLEGVQNADQVMTRMGDWIETFLATDDIEHLNREL